MAAKTIKLAGISISTKIMELLQKAFLSGDDFTIPASFKIPRGMFELEKHGYIEVTSKTEGRIGTMSYHRWSEPGMKLESNLGQDIALTDKCRELFHDVSGVGVKSFQRKVTEKQIFTALADILIHGDRWELTRKQWNEIPELTNDKARKKWLSMLQLLQHRKFGELDKKTNTFRLKSQEVRKEIVYGYAKEHGIAIDRLTDADREHVDKSGGDIDFTLVEAKDRSQYPSLMRLAVLFQDFSHFGDGGYSIPTQHAYRIGNMKKPLPTLKQINKIPTYIIAL